MEVQQLELLINKLPIEELITKIVSADRDVGNVHSRPAFLISNTDPAWLPGQHWVSFYFPTVGIPEFFYSFGHSPMHYSENFEYFLLRNSNNGQYSYNKQQLQRVDCIAFYF